MKNACFVQFKSSISHCGMFVTKEDFKILKAEPKIIVEHTGYFLTFTAKSILSIKTPSGKTITPMETPYSY